MGLAICSLTEVTLINGKNIVHLALTVSITVITITVRNQPDVSQPLTTFEGHLTICVFSASQVGRQEKHLVTLGAAILAYATGNKCLKGPPFG